MKREWFSRGVRMTHQFGQSEKVNDPLEASTWDLPTPPLNRTGGGRSRSCEIQQYGEANYIDDRSPVQTPNGRMANTQGPRPSVAEVFARPIPVGTKRRLGPPKTDK